MALSATDEEADSMAERFACQAQLAPDPAVSFGVAHRASAKTDARLGAGAGWRTERHGASHNPARAERLGLRGRRARPNVLDHR
jgi:hypothetical protein